MRTDRLAGSRRCGVSGKSGHDDNRNISASAQRTANGLDAGPYIAGISNGRFVPFHRELGAGNGAGQRLTQSAGGEFRLADPCTSCSIDALQRRVAQPTSETVGVLDRAFSASSLAPPPSDSAGYARSDLLQPHRQRTRGIRQVHSDGVHVDTR